MPANVRPTAPRFPAPEAGPHPGGRCPPMNAPQPRLPAPRGMLRQWHAALMPDYNRTATAVWCVVVAAGAVVLAGL
jgi:hypothetical protein